MTLSRRLLTVGEMQFMLYIQLAWPPQNHTGDRTILGILDTSILDAVHLKTLTQDKSHTRSQLRQIMYWIADKYDVYPSQMHITGNIVREKEPLAGGGFGDIYKGVYQGNVVAMKRLRVFLSTSPADIAKLKKVG